jgi:hypothetical protein
MPTEFGSSLTHCDTLGGNTAKAHVTAKQVDVVVVVVVVGMNWY